MMRKILAALLLLVSLCSGAYANASVVIQDVTTKTVLDHIVATWANSQQNFRIESTNEYGITIVVIRQQTQLLSTNTLINRLDFTAVSNEKDVILSLNETYTSNQPGGARNQPIGPDGELIELHKIKEYFNGRYCYGFTTGKKAKGGYIINSISDGDPAMEAGIKLGDILIAVNDTKIAGGKDQKYEFGLLPDRFDPGPTKFLISQDNQKKEFILQPKFRPGKNKTETSPVTSESNPLMIPQGYPTKRTYANGNIYEGYIVNGKAQGKGVFIWTNGDRYEGEFSNNEMNGKGVLTYSNGNRYEGNFINGKSQGMGVLVFANGDRYEGEFSNNEMHGKGVFISIGGERKEGNFRNGEYTGNGNL